MKAKNTLAMACALATAFVNVGAEAASGKMGLDACISELAREISEAQGAGVNVRISEDTKVSKRRLDHATTFFLDAREPGDGEIVTKVNCTVDRHAKVRKFVVLPDDAPAAEIRVL